jgi:hypothetical protein
MAPEILRSGQVLGKPHGSPEFLVGTEFRKEFTGAPQVNSLRYAVIFKALRIRRSARASLRYQPAPLPARPGEPDWLYVPKECAPAAALIPVSAARVLPALRQIFLLHREQPPKHLDQQPIADPPQICSPSHAPFLYRTSCGWRLPFPNLVPSLRPAAPHPVNPLCWQPYDCAEET